MKTLRVMIVEDDFRVRKVIRSIIEDIAGAVHECSNGEEAVQAYSQIQPDVVLMDLRMRGMDGLTATRMIRSLDPKARIIIVTSHNGPDLKDAARTAGASEYVLKENLLELRALLTTTSD